MIKFIERRKLADQYTREGRQLSRSITIAEDVVSENTEAIKQEEKPVEESILKLRVAKKPRRDKKVQNQYSLVLQHGMSQLLISPETLEDMDLAEQELENARKLHQRNYNRLQSTMSEERLLEYLEGKEQKIKQYFDAKQKITTNNPNDRSQTIYDTEGSYAHRFGSLESALSLREKPALRTKNDVGQKKRNSFVKKQENNFNEERLSDFLL